MTTTRDPSELPYTGPIGKTQSRYAIYNCRCGNRFAMEVFTSIDVTERNDLVQTLIEGNLNRGACNACGAAVNVETRCVLHDPAVRRMILFLPEKERHLELEARSELLSQLAQDPTGGLPEYVLNFEVAFGHEGLKDVLSRSPARATAAGLDERGKDLDTWEGKLRQREAQMEEKTSEVDRRFRQVEELSLELEKQRSELEARRREVEEFAHQLEMKHSAFHIEAKVVASEGNFPKEADESPATSPWVTGEFKVPSPLQESIEQALPEFDDDEQSATEEVGEESISVSEMDVVEEASIVSEEAIVDERPLEEPAQAEPLAHERPVHPPPDAPVAVEESPVPEPAKKPGRVDDEVLEALARPAKRLARIVDDKVDLFALTDDESLLDAVKKSSVRFRVHLVEDDDGYPWVVLSAAIRPPGREIYLFKWLLDYQERVHRRILGRLGEKCRAHITLVSPGMERNVTFMARNRIEGNVKSIASDLEQFFLTHAAVSSPADVGESNIITKLLDELKKPFPFHSKYVQEHSSPHGLLKALRNLQTWSTPEHKQRLIRTYSFPLEGLAAIKRRILTRAVEAGLDVPGNLPAEAVSMGLADDDTALLSHSLRAFMGLLRSDHDLTPDEVASNWKKLVDAALRRGMQVEVEVAEVAADYLRPLGEDLSFAAEVAMLDATPVADLDREVLLRWLYRPSRRAEVALELMRREDTEAFGAVTVAVKLMGPEDLLQVVPRILSDADDEGESFFTDCLKSSRSELRLASALALGKLGLRSAVVPLINALCEHGAPDWKIECIVLSRFGVAAIRTVEQFLRNPRGCDDKLVFLAAALALGRCEKHVKDMTGEADLMVSSLSKRALERRHVVKGEIEDLIKSESDDPLVQFVRSMDSKLSAD